MSSDRAREILHRAYMQGYREGRLSVLSERRQTPRRTRVATVLEQHLADGPKPASWIVSVTMKEGNVTERTVRAAKAELGIVSLREPRRGWMWALPSWASSTMKDEPQLAFPDETGIMTERCKPYLSA